MIFFSFFFSCPPSLFLSLSGSLSFFILCHCLMCFCHLCPLAAAHVRHGRTSRCAQLAVALVRVPPLCSYCYRCWCWCWAQGQFNALLLRPDLRPGLPYAAPCLNEQCFIIETGQKSVFLYRWWCETMVSKNNIGTFPRFARSHNIIFRPHTHTHCMLLVMFRCVCLFLSKYFEKVVGEG